MKAPVKKLPGPATLSRKSAPAALVLTALVTGAAGFWSTVEAQQPAVAITASEVPPAQQAPEEAPPPRETAPRVYPFPLEPATKQDAPKPLVENLAHSPPVVPAAVQEKPIDLSTALRLAERQSPYIGRARQAIELALAQQLQARALPLPQLRAGANYHKHDGVLQTSFGLIRHVDLSSLYFGAGSRAVRADTVAFPGVQFLNHMGDMFFEPLVARQNVRVREFEAAAAGNNVLLEVAMAYLDLLAAEGELAALEQSEREMDLIVQQTAQFSAKGKGRDSNARRARTAALLLHVQKQSAEERVAFAAAELSRVLHLDPSTRLHSPGRDIALLPLVDPEQKLEELIRLALSTRPELSAIRAEIGLKSTQVRQEKMRPLLPTLSVGYSAGGFGGGTNLANLVPVHPEFGRIGSRADFDVVAYWTLQGLGAGNIAAARKRGNERSLAQVDHLRLVNQVRREVTAAKALVEARRQEIDTALDRVAVARSEFDHDYIRIRNNEGIAVEIVDSMDRLADSRLNLIQVLAGYNMAQFQLFVALGQTPLAAASD
jgi:outer membrane protein TolC